MTPGMRDEGAPMQLIVPYDAASDNALWLQNELQKLGYEVAKEYHSDEQTVYNVYPKPEREVPANKLPPQMRKEAAD